MNDTENNTSPDSKPLPKPGWWRAPVCSPKGFLLRAAALLLLFLIAHIAGWREHTSVLCGTATSAAGWDRVGGTLGMVYVLFYFGALLGAPILVLAAGILEVLARFSGKGMDGKRMIVRPGSASTR
ncbi:MAG: hypothetical protein HY360_15645 [Verrucomicrobia bacterium]|nr:hypothetical protein [Verrucomicrobiota bacterium]